MATRLTTTEILTSINQFHISVSRYSNRCSALTWYFRFGVPELTSAALCRLARSRLYDPITTPWFFNDRIDEVIDTISNRVLERGALTDIRTVRGSENRDFFFSFWPNRSPVTLFVSSFSGGTLHCRPWSLMRERSLMGAHIIYTIHLNIMPNQILTFQVLTPCVRLTFFFYLTVHVEMRDEEAPCAPRI